MNTPLLTRPDTPGFNPGYRQVTLRLGFASFRMPRRSLVTSLTLFAVAALLGVLTLSLGDYPLSVGEVFAALGPDAPDFHQTIVRQWRIPVIVAALVFGALLGLGGAIFQSLTRNPLGSPDIIGFDAGSYTAVVTTMLVFGTTSYWVIAASSIGGGLLTASAVYLLAYRQGVQGFRLIIVGLAISAMLGSLNSYLITRADLDEALSVGFWGAGSIAGVTWKAMLPALVLSALIILAATVLAPALRQLELGDDAAVTLGTPVGKARLGLLVVGVATTALVTAAAGPIGFIALVAPQLARRITRGPGVELLPAAAMGSFILSLAYTVSMVISQFYRPIPVGLLTVVLGGLYLIWLLVREARRQYGPVRTS